MLLPLHMNMLLEVAAGAPPSALRKKRRWVLPDGRRFYGTDGEATYLVAQMRAAMEAQEKKKKPLWRRVFRIKPKPVKAADIFDIPQPLLAAPPDFGDAQTVFLSEIDLQNALTAGALAYIRQRQAEDEEDVLVLLLAA